MGGSYSQVLSEWETPTQHYSHTHTQDNTVETRRTIQALPSVLQVILTEADYSKIKNKVNGSTVAELTVVQQTDNTYLDDLLTIHHYTDIDVGRKRKKVEDNND